MSLLGDPVRLAQQLRRAGIDLHRRKEAAHETIVGAVEPIDEVKRALQTALTSVFVPFPAHGLAVAREPAARAIALRHVDAHSVAAGHLHHGLAGAALLRDGGSVFSQYVDHRELD